MSTEFKHTPGPWKVYYPDAIGCGLGIDTADSKTSIVVFGDEAGVYGYGEQDEANARLIAAAPELLEALQNMYACFVVGTSADAQMQAAKYAELIIQKATGQ